MRLPQVRRPRHDERGHRQQLGALNSPEAIAKGVSLGLLSLD